MGFFNEFTLNLRCGPGPLLADLAEAGYMGGVDLTRFGEELPGDLLVAVTERRTRAEIDGFIQAFAEALV